MKYINRLWVRISLNFVGIVVFIIFVPMMLALTFGAARKAFHPDASVFPQPGDKARGEMFDVNPGAAIAGMMLGILSATTIIGSVVGVITARGITAPLDRLAQAAKSIAAHDLGSRVEISGSVEIRTVAQAFNDMAAALEQAEQLRSNLLADVAHELRTPLTVIQGNLRAILDDVFELDKAEITRLYEQTRHLTRLVNDLRELAQAEARQLPLSLAELDMNAWVQEIAATFRPIAAAENVNLELEIPSQPTHLQADKARLTQSLHNLLYNALQHTPAGGAITIQVEQCPERIHLHVRDTGAGIAPEHIEYIFDRFYRTDRARSRDTGGTGLGLAIVRAIAEAHGGRVTAASQGIGQGSIFTIELPV